RARDSTVSRRRRGKKRGAGRGPRFSGPEEGPPQGSGEWGRTERGKGTPEGDGRMPETIDADLVDKTTAAWKAAGERGDAAAAAECLAEGAELVSPLTAQFRFCGRERVGEVLTVAFQVVDGIRYHTEVGDGGTRAVFFTASCRGRG